MTLSDLDVYERICVPRFAAIEANQKELSDDVHAIREKLFNGLSGAIERIEASTAERKRSKALMIRDVILTLLGSGGIVSLILMKLL